MLVFLKALKKYRTLYDESPKASPEKLSKFKKKSLDIRIPISSFKVTHESHFIEYLDPSCPPEKYQSKPPLFQWLTFSDILPHVKKINESYPNFGISDLPNPEPIFSTDKKVIDLDFHWMNESSKPNPKFSNALCKTFSKEIINCLILVFIDNTTRIFHSIYMGKIIGKITSRTLDEAFDYGDLIISATLLSVFILISLMAKNWSFYIIGNTLALAKQVTTGMLYKKLNCISLTSLHEINVGKVINLIGNDLGDFHGMLMIPSMLLTPYMIGLGTYMMWGYFGPSCLLGLICLILIVILQINLSNRTASPRKENKKVADDRIKLTNEVIECIRLIKMYTWEKLFKKRILDLREKEHKTFKKIIYLDILGRNFSTISVYLNILVVCITFTYFKGVLSPEKVYASMIILTYLGSSLLSSYQGRMSLVNFRMISKRIEELLVVRNIVKVEETSAPKRKASTGFDRIQTAYFNNFIGYWSFTTTKPCLSNITASFVRGTITAVIGRVGSGKSSLLFSFLRELPVSSGVMKCYGKVSYVEQEPIIFGGTLRENILFGNDYDEDLYRQVIKDCNLEKDLELFAFGDLTQVGERGTTLSGGQKARVGLARAFYSQSDIYLLDDPFSALDGRVARSIFDNVLKGESAQTKTIIFTTHHLNLAQEADHIILMDKGSIEAQGTFEDLEKLDINLLNISKNEELAVKLKKANSEIYENNKNEINKAVSETSEQVTKEEANETTFQTYKDYFSVRGTRKTLMIFIILYGIPEVLTICFVRLIGYWAHQHNLFYSTHQASSSDRFDNNYYVAMFCTMILLIFMVNYIKGVKTKQYLFSTNTEIHRRMLERVMRAQTLFFDMNPVGRILNRFSSDMGVLDKVNPKIFFDFLEGMVSHLCLLITVCLINPYVLVPAPFVIYGLYKTKILFEKPMILINKLNSISRSPILSFIPATLQGLIMIRVYNQGGRFIKDFMNLVYDNTKTFAFHSKQTRLVSLLLDVPVQILTISGIWIFVVLMFFYHFEPGLLGLALMYLLKIADQTSYIVRQLLYLDNNMQSSQRILDYCKIESERPDHIEEADKRVLALNEQWPSKGEIVFNNVNLKYRQDSGFALNGINLQIFAGQKVAFVGRTGAGKSSIIQALFRMVEIEESSEGHQSYISIDGVDIQSVGLHLLRKGVAIIPQIPPVFSGSIRKNIDPFEDMNDDQLWDVLEEVDLKEHVSSLENKLDTDMTFSTTVFSAGQRQLMCLARTIISKCKVIVLDEATASVDFETDQFVQNKITEKFSGCTVITVAHRLITIANYDKIFVMEKGQIAEEGAPYELLVNKIGDQEITKRGLFSSMVKSTGDGMATKIFEVAREQFFLEVTKTFIN